MSETTTTCVRCGAAVDAGYDFCPKCGNAMKGVPPPIPAGPPSLPKKPVPVLLIGAVAGAAVLLLAVGAFFMIPKGPDRGISARISLNSDAPGGASLEVSGKAGEDSGKSGGGLPDIFSDHPISGTFHCRKGAEFDVDPEDAIFAIDDVVIGKVDDFDGKGGGKTYYFKGPGTYIARFTMKGYRTAWVKIVVSPDAAESVVSVDTELKER